jgi:cold shock CspA family protein
MAERLTGIITSIRADRHFGFICPEGRDGEEIFFHSSAAPDWSQLKPGDAVTFIERNTPKGKRALAVQQAVQQAQAKE